MDISWEYSLPSLGPPSLSEASIICSIVPSSYIAENLDVAKSKTAIALFSWRVM